MTSKPDLEDPLARCLRGDRDLVDLARKHGLSPAAAEAVASIDAVMTGVRRSMQRRDFGRAMLAELNCGLEIGHLDTISAIAYAAEPASNAPAPEVTVGFVAERLGIDPSRASRLTSEVVERGYARRVASQSDARRICLELTETGLAFIESVRRSKWELFSRSLSRWTEEDLVTFAMLLSRFASWATDDAGVPRTAEAIRRHLGGAERPER